MKRLKKVLALVLSLCLLTTMTTMVSAETEATEDTHAFLDILNAQLAQTANLTTANKQIFSDYATNLDEAPVSYSARAISNPNYTKLRNYIQSQKDTDSDGNPRIVRTLETTNLTSYFTLTNVSTGIKFQYLGVEDSNPGSDVLLNFVLTNTSNNIKLEGIATYSYNGNLLDYELGSTTIDQRNYTKSSKLYFYKNSYSSCSSSFSELMTTTMQFLCLYWDQEIYECLGFGLGGLGFTSYGGSTPTCTSHIYDNACDTSCNVCGATRTTYHTYSNSCDAYCNVCGASRSVTHTYGGSCDTTCNVCGTMRSVSYSHSYSTDCDARCDNCGDIRTAPSNHTFEGSSTCWLCYATFSDVSASSWMISPVVYVYDNGLMAGKGSDKYGDVKFDPSSPITREEFVQVLYNAENKPSVSISNRFPDVANSGWYKNAVLWANANNIANGQGDGKFGVGKNITRQDLAMMLYKYASFKGYSLDAYAGEIYKYADGNKVSGYAQTAMDWAVTNGVLSGKGTSGRPISTFKLDPAGTATRAECAAMLKNFMTAFSGSGDDDLVIMTHAGYMAAAADEYITIEAYVQGTQEWYDGTINIYAQDYDGGYYIYYANCTAEEAERLVPGTKIRVTGYKAVWAGQHEIINGEIEILDDGDTYIADPINLTSYLGSDAMYNYQGMLGAFKGMTVETIQYKNGEPGDDIYVTVSYRGFDYEFVVEVYLTGTSSNVYRTVESLRVGDVVDIEGFVYWYEGINPHITAISKR